jgi:transposase-like protein
MPQALKSPQTLREAIVFFSDEQRAFESIRDRRWPNGVVCPRCQCEKVGYVETRRTAKDGSIKVRRLWNCHGCKEQFTVKTRSIFEDSPLPFSKWLPAMWLIANAKNGISSCELHRALGVTQKTAWFMLHRIRLAMQNGTFEKLMDDVEVDETYIGGKSRNMHKHVRERKITGTGGKDETIVFGMIERGGTVKAQVVAHPKKKTLERIIQKNVLSGCNVYSDALRSYEDLGTWYRHQVIDHAVAYVNGNVHTNCMENFWSLLKRGLGGTYISVEPFHLFRYLDEQAFRFNERKGNDADRFQHLASQVAGKRLTYKALIGKELAAG